jgi:hypothetical protein
MTNEVKQETLQRQDDFLQSELMKLLKECQSINDRQHSRSSVEDSFSVTSSPRSLKLKCSLHSKSAHLASSESPDPVSSTADSTLGVKDDSWMSTVTLDMTDPDLQMLLHSHFTQIQAVNRDLEVLNDQQRMEINQLHLDLQQDPDCSLGGWDEDSHATFMKIFRKATTTGMARKVMMEVLANALPDQSHECLLVHEEYVRGMKRIQKKYKQLEQAHIVNRQELILSMAKDVKEFNSEKLERMRSEQELQDHEVKRTELHARLEALRNEKQLILEERRINEQLQQEVTDKQQQLKLQQLEFERQERLRTIAEFQERKRQQLSEQNAQMELERKRMAEELKQMIEENRSKVELRAHKIAEKNLQRKLREVRKATTLCSLDTTSPHIRRDLLK